MNMAFLIIENSIILSGKPEMDQTADPLDLNPWTSPNIDDFLHYCCPECDLKTKDGHTFYEHAIHAHERAYKALALPEQIQTLSETPTVKTEKGEVYYLDYKAEDVKCEVDLPSDQEDHFDDQDEEEDEFEAQPKPKRPKKSSSTSAVQCYFCSEIFAGGKSSQNLNEVKTHIETEHNLQINPRLFGKPREFKCEQCNIVHKDDEQLKMHICGIIPPDWTGGSLLSKAKCPKCEMELTTFKSMLEHYARMHSDEKKFSCDKCDFLAATMKQLRDHKAGHEKNLHCNICHRHYKNIRSLEKHQKEIHEQKAAYITTIKCDMCDFEGKPGQTKAHKQAKHPNGTKYKCDECHYIAVLEFHLKQHQKLKHQANNLCTMCPKRFYYPSQLKKHMETDHGDSDASSKVCHICGRVYEDKMHLKRCLQSLNNETKEHFLKKPLTEGSDYTCDKCGKGYPTPLKLKLHYYNVHGPKAFMCMFCERMFSRIRMLQEHLGQEHAFEVTNNIYICTKCDATFVTCSDLNTHCEQDHGMPSIASCQDCGHTKSFVSQTLLTAHKIESHEFDPLKKVENVDDLKHKYKCDICGKYSKTEGILRDHKKMVHEKESHAYKCDLCPFSTHQMSRLKQHHQRSHVTGFQKRTYQCTECPKVVTEKRYLRLHLLNVHGIVMQK